MLHAATKDNTSVLPVFPSAVAGQAAALTNPLDQYKVIRRNGSVVPFEPAKISVAMTKAFIAVAGGQGAASARVREMVELLTNGVVWGLMRRLPNGGTFHIEDIQDQVELALMRSGEHDVARAYVLYREERARSRADSKARAVVRVINVAGADGVSRPLDMDMLSLRVQSACAGLGDAVEADAVVKQALKGLYDGVSDRDVRKCLVYSARSLIEKEPAYDYVAARLLLDDVCAEVLGEVVEPDRMTARYAGCFADFIKHGIDAGLLDVRLAQFDLERLGRGLDAQCDLQFGYAGLQTLCDQYLLRLHGKCIELPQVFFMRVAMGQALNETDRDVRAIEFYRLLSSFDFMISTPALLNAGTLRPRLSSCYLSTVADNLAGVYEAIKEDALIADGSGGLGNDWTPVRALGSRTQGGEYRSRGVVPFLKVVDDTALAVNQGGKRKGAVCVYLETWHLDIEEFLDLRKDNGEERRRTHDMNTANWIPDLFMKRVMEGGEWTLFSPSDVPDLHDRYGADFERAYIDCEAKVARGEIGLFKKIPAQGLWRKMLSTLFETGHPWIAFKDACNVRSPQQHAGVVHSSGLCAEVVLNTSDSEIAVCNLGSVNLVAHLYPRGHEKAGQLDHDKLRRTVSTALRMLDNAVDINYYAVDKARNSSLKHRPAGLGIMGFQDSLHELRIPYASQAAIEFADMTMEAVCYYAYLASTELAEERGSYASYRGSLWDRGILPQDTLAMLHEQRGGYLEVDMTSRMDWDALRARIKLHGMRNSNCVAVAPTATIAGIAGVSASIDPCYRNVMVNSGRSGEFTVINRRLVADLKQLGLWDEVMIADIKYFDGSLAKIDRIPAECRNLYANAYEIDSGWLIEAASRRQKWIDQAQTLNIYFAGLPGQRLDELYKLAWVRGLKTTYCLRAVSSAASVEKSVGRAGMLNAVHARCGIVEKVKCCPMGSSGSEICQQEAQGVDGVW